MGEQPEILAAYLVDCRSADNRPMKVGAGATLGGRILLLRIPEDRTPELNQHEALQVVRAVRRAIQDAAERG